MRPVSLCGTARNVIYVLFGKRRQNTQRSEKFNKTRSRLAEAYQGSL